MTQAASSPVRSPMASSSQPRAIAPVSVVILTLNEEMNIIDCLESCSWSDDVHVLDSGSTDRTIELAEEYGAKAHVHPFESFGKQRNWAIDNIEMKHDWIFHLDADERFTPELIREMKRLIATKPKEAGFHIPNKLMFMGRWLKWSSGYPTYQMRLFHRKRMRFTDHGHGQREDTEGRVSILDEPYLHYGFSKGVYDWIEKHNRYSSLEALQIVRAGPTRVGLRQLFGPDPIKRRRAWKEYGYRIPGWPWIRFFITLVAMGGIFEGRAGWNYAKLMAMYEQMMTIKLRLLRSRAYGDDTLFEKDTAPAPAATGAAPASPTPSRRRGPTPEADGAFSSRSHEELADDAGSEDRGQLTPEASPWTLKEKLIRVVWMLAGRPLFRLSFHNWYGFRATMLRIFGAEVGENVSIRPTVKIEIPWNLEIRDGVIVGDHAILYSLGKITIGERTIISQYAHLCAGTHDFTSRVFPLIRDPIWIGQDVWIGADAFVGPNVRVGRLSVLGARSSTYKDLEPQTVYVGNPAKALKRRELK